MAFPSQLSWTHYRRLLSIENEGARAFYEIETAAEGWSTRALERQISSLLYERLAKSRDKDGVVALAHEGQQVTTPESVLKDPLVLEFLYLGERPQWRERDLEQAIHPAGGDAGPRRPLPALPTDRGRAVGRAGPGA